MFPIQLVAKVTNFDADLMHKICWECYTNSHDPNQTKFLALISQQSAITLWLIFNKLDTDGTLYLHPEVCPSVCLVSVCGCVVCCILFVYCKFSHVDHLVIHKMQSVTFD